MNWKTICKKLLFPPLWLMILLTIASAALLITVFANGLDTSVLAYITYALSFYTLSVVTLFCVIVLPKQYKQIHRRILDHPFGNRLLTDRVFRTKLGLYASLLINALYICVNLLSWHWSKSWWFVVLAVYYGIMAIMRFLLVRYVQKNTLGTSVVAEWKRARICACFLLLINLSLSGAVLMILYQNRGYDYPGMMIYVMALYTFYSTIHAIIEIVRHRKMGSPIMSTAKVISLSAALVSMLNLETAMFAQFGKEMSHKTQQLFIILTGAGVSITVITLSVLLIIMAGNEIRRENHG